MSDGEALEDLAASLYYLGQARKQAESEEVVEVVDDSLEFLDQQMNEVLKVVGREEYQSDGPS